MQRPCQRTRPHKENAAEEVCNTGHFAYLSLLKNA